VPTSKLRLAAYSLVLAVLLWILVFVIRPFDFWVLLAFATLTLMIVSLSVNHEPVRIHISIRMIVYGVVSAFLLYALFYFGFQATKSNPVFSEGVSQVYLFRSSTPLFIIGLLLVFPIGPGEEIYWRGLIQKRFAERLGGNAGLLCAATAYALVHLPTFNPPLVLTAFIGGLVWGYVYRTSGSLVPAIISHVLWDLLIFVVLPLT
jgi:membrane protease YdiL (CAAX protease family)